MSTRETKASLDAGGDKKAFSFFWRTFCFCWVLGFFLAKEEKDGSRSFAPMAGGKQGAIDEEARGGRRRGKEVANQLGGLFSPEIARRRGEVRGNGMCFASLSSIPTQNMEKLKNLILIS